MKLTVKVLLTAVLTTAGLLIVVASPAGALNTAAHAPDQASCDTAWASAGVTRPVVTAMTVNGETVAAPSVPTNGHLGVYVCPGQGGQRAAVSVYQESGGSGYIDLGGATSPSGVTVTAATPITLTFTNFGSNAATFAYAVVTGHVDTWTTANLGTPSASLTVAMKPVIAPFIDGTTNPGQCAPQPIGCTIVHSTADILSAEMDMSLVPGDGQMFRGSYFSITGATGGAVTPINDGSGPRGFTAGVAGPHFLADGTTQASGSMSAYLPTAAVGALFSSDDPTHFDTTSVDVTRDEGGAETTPNYTITQVTGGIQINIPTVTFSSPDYNFELPQSSDSHASNSGDGGNASGGGYRLYGADGGVFAYGSSKYFGSANTLKLGGAIVAGINNPDGNGYWEIGSDGGVFAYGSSKYFGSANTLKLGGKIVGGASTPDGQGYWLFGADGGVFAYGDAKFFGSAGSLKLAKPIVGGSSSPDGRGYWLFAADGGVFAYGSSKYFGSANTLKLGAKIVGGSADPQGIGYTLFGADGGVFAYGAAQYFGSPNNSKLGGPIVSGEVTPDGDGYLLTGSDGGAYAYGAAPFLGSAATLKPAKPIVSGS